MVRNSGTALAAFLLLTLPAWGQRPDAPRPAKAALLSFLVPGLGQHYANGQSWRGSASFYLISESLYLAGMATSEWHRAQTVQSYRTWAASKAQAQIEGKDRTFFVTIGQHHSSEAFRTQQLLNRRWDQLSYVADPANHWAWRSTEDLQAYRDLRSEADSWAQRRSMFIAVMVGNRVLSALQALRAARRNQVPNVSVAASSTPLGEVAAHLTVTF